MVSKYLSIINDHSWFSLVTTETDLTCILMGILLCHSKREDVRDRIATSRFWHHLSFCEQNQFLSFHFLKWWIKIPSDFSFFSFYRMLFCHILHKESCTGCTKRASQYQNNEWGEYQYDNEKCTWLYQSKTQIPRLWVNIKVKEFWLGSGSCMTDGMIWDLAKSANVKLSNGEYVRN